MTEHDRTARTIARCYGTYYKEGKGPDIIANNCVIEVATLDEINEAFPKLSFYNCNVYIAGANHEATEKIVNEVMGTAVGAMNHFGDILVESTRFCPNMG